MTVSNKITVTCDQCGGQIAQTEHTRSSAVQNFGLSPGWWQIYFAEERDGKWQADLCSRRCLAHWVDGWRVRPDLKIV